MNFDAHMNELDAADAAAFRALAARLREAPQREPSASLDGRILAAVDAERGRLRSRLRMHVPWWGVAAAAAAVRVVGSVAVIGARGPAGPSDSFAAGVAWLAESQEPDGTWSPSKHGGAEAYRPALTALAALALDHAGARQHAGRIRRACAALAALQTADGAFGGEGRARLYNHAITTFALATLCPGQPSLKPALERALVASREQQSAEGGWDYEAGSPGNAALTAWQVRALACAEAQDFATAKVPLRKGLRWLRGNARDDGSVAYHRASTARSDGLTALAAHALITAGKGFPGLPELGRLAVGSLNAAPERAATADCYRDYAKVLAFDSAGAGRQADAVRWSMLKLQKVGGRDQWEAAGGRLYTAALTALASK
jgi:hypothetical protein